MTVHQSRWGYHPCDFETFQVLKKLSTRYWHARRGYADWCRWFRKKPANRVIRQYLRDAKGHKIGSRVVGPRAAPAVCSVFCQLAKVASYWWDDGTYVPHGRSVDGVVFVGDPRIVAAFRAARKPATSAELVEPLPLTADEIRQLAERFLTI